MYLTRVEYPEYINNSQLKNKEANNPFKMDKDLTRHLAKENIQTAKKDTKRCSTSQIIRKMQIKTTIREVPRGPMVRTWCFQCCGISLTGKMCKIDQK